MNKYIVDPEQGKRLKEAVRLLADSPGWNTWADFELEVLKALKEKDESLTISHPHYERMKAYMQGQINALKYLIEARKGIKEGKHGRRTEINPGSSEFPEGFRS